MDVTKCLSLQKKLVTELSEEVGAGQSLAGVARVATALRAPTQQRASEQRPGHSEQRW